MKPTADTIGLRFFGQVGEEIHPKSLTVKELIKLMTSLEDTLFVTVQNQNPEIKKEDVYLSLVDVIDSSAGYRFLPSMIDVVVTAYLTITTSINSQNFEGLPPESITTLQPIIDFTNQRQCKAQLRLGNELLATIEPTSRDREPVLAEIGSRYIYGNTTLYANVQRVGGTKPKAMLKISQSETLLYIDITAQEAKKLAERLYNMVALTGTAMYESKTLRLVNFRIDEILDFEEVSINDAFSEVSDVLEKYWDNIDDVDAFLYNEISFED